MRTTSGITAVTCIAAMLLSLAPPDALSRNPIRQAFFSTYPSAAGTRLATLPSNADHCGVCHYNFDGGGPRNAYGAQVEVAIGTGLSNTNAILSVENLDSDNDGYTNLVEITSALFSNTPTFPGLKSGNEGSTSNVSLAEITPYLTPTGGADTTPPSITVLSPNGGGTYAANTTVPLTWTATDASGVESVTLYFSDDGGLSFKPLSFAEVNDGTFNWFVPNRPGSQSLIRAVAKDSAGNYGSDWSDGTFTITAATDEGVVIAVVAVEGQHDGAGDARSAVPRVPHRGGAGCPLGG